MEYIGYFSSILHWYVELIELAVFLPYSIIDLFIFLLNLFWQRLTPLFIVGLTSAVGAVGYFKRV
jgi:hypothetical protein